MDQFYDKAKSAVLKAGVAAIVAFVTVLLQSFGIPTPDPDILPDLPDIVGAGPDAMQAVNAAMSQATTEAAKDATLKTAISIPTILFFVDFGVSLLSLFGKKSKEG